MTVSLLVITDGRYDYLCQTIQSLNRNVKYDFAEKIIINDAVNPDFDRAIRQFDGFKVISHQTKKGLAGAVRTGWESVSSDYIFHVEEDFVFNKIVDITEMISILNNCELGQLSLKRQPVNGEEAAAGGFIQTAPDLYIQKESYVEHSRVFSLNPCIYRKTLTEFGWPEHGSEGDFTANLLKSYPNMKFGILGTIDEAPRVTHIGDSRSDLWQV